MEPSSDISTESIDVSVQKSVNRVRKRKKQLYADLRKQMEFYLSDANLRKDRFFGNLMQFDQCVSVETFLNCNKIKSLTTSPELIVKAIEGSDILAVSDCKTKVHRIKPIKDKTPEEIERCTVYVEQLPLKADHDWVKSMFEKYGNVAYVSLPKFKSGTIKRFAFVEFDNEESANKVLEEYKKLHVESKILPEELQSIITFKEDEENKDGSPDVDENTDNVSLVKKRKLSCIADGIKEKKRRKETQKLSPIVIKSNKKKKKEKYKKSDIESDQKNSNEISDYENNQKALLKVKVDYNIVRSEKNVSKDDFNKKVIQSNNDILEGDQKYLYKIKDTENNQKTLLNDNLSNNIVQSEKNILSKNLKKEKIESKNLVIDNVNFSNEPNINKNNYKTFMTDHSDSTNVKNEGTSNEIIKRENNMDHDDSAVKKKRKRNKGKKIKSDTTLSVPELRIMSKTEWKKLRNQFLNMQRQKMSLLKVQLRNSRYKTSHSSTNFHENQNDPSANEENIELKIPKTEDMRVKFEPGVILKVSFPNPIESDKTFKAEAKTDSNIKFVDIISNFEAYIRCDSSESAKKIANENRWPQTRQLEGEEEKLYWEKILHDRETKCTKQKGTKKQRGRSRLINKAEKTLAHHIKFIQEVE